MADGSYKSRTRKPPAEDSSGGVALELRHPWTLTHEDLEGIAQGLHDEIERRIAEGIGRAARLRDVPRELFWPATMIAEALGVIVVEEARVPGEGRANMLPGFVTVQTSKSRPKVNVRIAHELCEDYFHRRGGHYCHADVWALTLMLLIPRRLLKHAELNRHVPRWVVSMRRALARTAERWP